MYPGVSPTELKLNILLLNILNNMPHLSDQAQELPVVIQWVYFLVDKCITSKQGTWVVNKVS